MTKGFSKRRGKSAATIIALVSTYGLLAAEPASAQVSPGTDSPDESSPVVELGIDVSAGYTDNVFATRNYKVDDFLLIARPSTGLTFVDGQDRLVVRGEGEIGRYESTESEDYEDWLVGIDGRLRASRNLTLLGGGEFQWEHEGRSSPDAENGIEPTRYERLYMFGGAIARSGKVSIRPALQFNRYDFHDVEADGGFIENDDRDRSQIEAGARLAYAVADGTDLFLQGAFDRRDYDREVDDFGYRRDSRGGSIVAGIRRIFSPQLSGEAFIGYLGQNYEDPRLEDVSTIDAGALVTWTGLRGLAATFRVDRSAEETTLPAASSYLLTSGSLTLSATPHSRLQTGLTVAGSKYDYRGDPRSEFVTSGNLWLRLWLNRHIYAGLDYSLSQRASNAAGFDYDENRLMIRLGAELRPRYSAAAPPIRFDDVTPGGFYAGMYGAHGTMVTGLDGPRGRGSNTADFGDRGFAGGVMLGYGTTVGNLYLGAELEGALGGPKWLHVADRTFSIRKKDSFGLAARAGWIARSGSLIYGRIGVSSTALNTEYLHSENLFDDTARYAGLAFGVGAEAATARHGFVRAEYVLTSYGDVDVPTGNEDFDNLSTSEGQFRLGAGLRFGKSAADAGKAASPTRFGGPYVGLQFGHGGLVSRNRGIRSGGTSIDIQRSGLGPVGGIFGGIGGIWRPVYAGIEADAEVSGIDWNIERDPDGRVYSAERQYSASIAARVGWIISQSALFYVRAGPAWTKFRIPYATSGDSVLSKRTQAGLRIGAGLELGISSRGRFRVDYSTTGYGDYDVDYGEGNSDRFNHRDNVARLGVAWGI